MDFKWKKLGKVFTPQEVEGKDWCKDYAQSPSALVFDEFVRVYFSCRQARDQEGRDISYCAYIDLDRGNLLKTVRMAEHPVFELGHRGEFDEFGTYIMSALQVGGAVRAYYAGITRCVSVPFNTAIGMAISEDGGETFKKYGRGPIIGYSTDEPFIMSGPKIRIFNGIWYLFYIAGQVWKLMEGRPEPVYKIRLAVSKDGIHWEKQNRDLLPSKLEEDEVQSGPDVIFANGKYHMFFCYRYSGNHRGKEKSLRIGYASSDNLLDWVRDDSKAGIDVSEEGWDSEMVRYPHVFELDKDTYMFYNGNEFGRNGFGLARLEGSLCISKGS
jgi:sucrose-6-phosphate hydrolase SacC (GH32 family)